MADLGLDGDIAQLETLHETSTGWATRVQQILRFALHSASATFGSAALHNVGERESNLAELGPNGRFPIARLEVGTAAGLNAGTDEGQLTPLGPGGVFPSTVIPGVEQPDHGFRKIETPGSLTMTAADFGNASRVEFIIVGGGGGSVGSGNASSVSYVARVGVSNVVTTLRAEPGRGGRVTSRRGFGGRGTSELPEYAYRVKGGGETGKAGGSSYLSGGTTDDDEGGSVDAGGVPGIGAGGWSDDSGEAGGGGEAIIAYVPVSILSTVNPITITVGGGGSGRSNADDGSPGGDGAVIVKW